MLGRAQDIDAHNQTRTSLGLRGRNRSRDLLRPRIMGVRAYLITKDMRMMILHKKMTLKRKMRIWLTTEIMSLLNPNYSEVIQSRINSMSTTQHKLSGLNMEAIE